MRHYRRRRTTHVSVALAQHRSASSLNTNLRWLARPIPAQAGIGCDFARHEWSWAATSRDDTENRNARVCHRAAFQAAQRAHLLIPADISRERDCPFPSAQT